MSKELTALKALNGKAAADISADEIKAANQELVEAGFNGIELSLAGAWAKANDTLTEKTTALETAEESLATAEERITTLEAELKEYKPDEAAAASADHSEPKADKDNIVEAEGEKDAGEAVNAEMFSKVKDMGIDIPK